MTEFMTETLIVSVNCYRFCVPWTLFLLKTFQGSNTYGFNTEMMDGVMGSCNTNVNLATRR